MQKKEKNRVKEAQKFISSFFEQTSDEFLFHNYSFLTGMLHAAREIAHGEGVDKDDHQLGFAAILLKDLGIVDEEDGMLNNKATTDRFAREFNLSEEEVKELDYYIDLLRHNRIPKNRAEEVLKDAAHIHLAYPDALERIDLLRQERERTSGKKYEDPEWLDICQRYYTTHPLLTSYAKQKFGSTRSKNFIEIERQHEKLKLQESRKLKNGSVESAMLSNKEMEDLFKIAFRNYVDLISVADRKAGIMIQVNSILSSVMIAFAIRNVKTEPIFAIPTGIILLSALVTIVYSILASRPRQKPSSVESLESEYFFFGSFDRVDNNFKKITWPEYSASMERLFVGEKKEIFSQITRETYQVRKVLAYKFGYLAIAYKVFVIGLSLAITTFFIIFAIKHG